MVEQGRHDKGTVAAIAAVAFVVADLSHEGLGHGVAAHLAGAKEMVLSYTYLSSDVQSRWISGAGPLVNVLVGLAALGVLRWARMTGGLRLFLFLLMCFNLLDAAAYLVYSGVLGSGDLAVAIGGTGWARLGMIVAGLPLYGGVVLLGARGLARLGRPYEGVVMTAYLVALGLNCAAAVVNPLGLKYFLISALPATAGANVGLFAMARLAGGAGKGGAVSRSYGWMAAGLVTEAIFVGVIGRGVTLSR